MKNIRFFLIVVFSICLISNKVFGQTILGNTCYPLVSDNCLPPAITNSGTYHGCDTFTFTPTITDPGLTITSYSWSPTGGLTASGVDSPGTTSIIFPDSCVTYNLTINAIGPNLIKNGGFDIGGPSWYPCFRTAYQNGSGSSGNTSDHIKVGNSGSDGCYTCDSFCSHTGGCTSGSMSLIVHGALAPFSPSSIQYFWGEEVNLCRDQQYTFTYYARVWCDEPSWGIPDLHSFLGDTGTASYTLESSSAAGVILTLGDTTIGPLSGGCMNDYWQQVTQTFTAPGTGTYFICIADYTGTSDGNQVAVDDISLVRQTTATGPAVTLCPGYAPTETITYTLPPGCDLAPCPGDAVAYTIHGNDGDIVTYTVTTPSGTYGPHTITIGSTLYYVVPGTYDASVSDPGNVCLTITNIKIGSCNFHDTLTSCVDEEPPTATISAPYAVCAGDSATIVVFGPVGGTVTILPTSFVSGPWPTFVVHTVGYGTGVSYTYPVALYNAVNFCVTEIVTSCCSVIPSGLCADVAVTTGPDVFLDFAPITACSGDPIELTAASLGGSTPYSYYFTGPAGSGLPDTTYNPVDSTRAYAQTGYYYVTATDSGGCVFNDTTYMDPYPSPLPFTGPDSVCVGDTVTLTLTGMGGGAWTVSPTTIASIDDEASTDTNVAPVIGISAGTATVTLTTWGGCSTTRTETVLALPGAITGSEPICVGANDTLSCSPPGGVWSVSSSGLATVSVSGVVTGRAGPGTLIVTYTSTCGSRTVPVTIKTSPGPVIGPDEVCVGSTISLTDPVPGGIWSETPATISTITSTGVVTGDSAGIAVVTYLLPATNCAVTDTIAVHPLPAAITATSRTVCTGDSILLTDSSEIVGTWASGDLLIATIGTTTGMLTGVSAGTVTIIYTLPSGCSVTLPINVIAGPAPISGPDTVCTGDSIALADITPDGYWATTAITSTIATVSSSGEVRGVSTGTATISYVAARTGCSVEDIILVDSLPIIPPISGPDSVCPGSSITLSDTYGGGVWRSANTALATVNASTGVVTGADSGWVNIVYTVTNNCGSNHVTYPVYVRPLPVVPPITGYAGVCTGVNDTLSDDSTGGTWTSADATVATVDPVTGIATGVGTGLVNVSYTVTNACGSTTVFKTMSVNMPPYITTNFVVACQTLGTLALDFIPGPPTIVSSAGCNYVCDSTTARYYGNGVAGSVFTWDVIGGTVIHDYGDSIDVLWGVSGITGSIILYDTVSHCSGEDSICIQVIQKPVANFSKSSDTICLNSTVYFTDLSSSDSASPILSRLWSFGDGTFYSGADPAHTYTSMGTDTITYVVSNICGCTDTMRQVDSVSNTPGPIIVCAAIVCDSQSATYSTPAVSGCTAYDWSVIGGVIIGGAGTPVITVIWNAIGPDGTGYVKLVEPDCAGICNDTTTIRIPVIPQNPAISGPASICAGAEAEFSLPLWPATTYSWGVVGCPSCLVTMRGNNTVALEFPGPGTYIVHGWYQNKLKLCGGNVFDTVTALPVTTINGPLLACENVMANYTLADGLAANWNITGPADTTESGPVFSYSFPATGVYFLSATGGSCATPITIDVSGPAAALDTIYGKDTVCLGRVYTYTAGHTSTSSTPEWSIVGGTVSPTSGYTVNVIWTSTGTKTLSAYRQNILPPFCTGPVKTLNVMQEVIAPVEYGETSVCANTSGTYSTTYTRAETYSWAIVPDTAGSVVAGADTTTATIDWNNVTSAITAEVILTVHKCDSVVSDTLTVSVTPAPGQVLTPTPAAACPHSVVGFKALAGDSTYLWSFGDGSPSRYGTDTITWAFPTNTTSGLVDYTVRVTGIPPVFSGSCLPHGSATTVVAILPGPVPSISTSQWEICPVDEVDSSLAAVAVTNNVSGLTYQWYENGVAMSGATDTTIFISNTAVYNCVVTAGDGCKDTSNSIEMDTCEGYALTGSVPVYGVVSCNTITLYGNRYFDGYDFRWLVDEPTASATALSDVVEQVQYNNPGIYISYFDYTSTSLGYEYGMTTDTIPIITGYQYGVRCAATGDSIMLRDHSTLLPWYTVTSIDWYSGAGLVAMGDSATIIVPAPGTYTITETVHYTGPDGPSSCSAVNTIVLPALPHPSFTFGPSPVCEGVPVNFTSTSTGGIIGYDWNFGDTSSSLLQNPKRTYTFDPLSPTNPQLLHASLTVTDTLGCSVSDTQIVQIYENLLNGGLGLNQFVCANNIPIILNWRNTPGITVYPPDSFAWSNGVHNTTGLDTISTSGEYWVTVFDTVKQCQKTFPIPTLQVTIVPLSTAAFAGLQNYCLGDSVQLYSDDRSGVAWQWYRNDTADGVNPSLNDRGLGVGAYDYQLVVSVTDVVTCYDTSAVDTVHMYALPPDPIISGPVTAGCSPYLQQLTAAEPMDGTYNWSNGSHGAIDSVRAGGPYRVWFTDLQGCVSHADINVPFPVDGFLAYFPTGCYALCIQQLPITLYGPPGDTLDYWAWIDNGDTLSSGTNSVMLPLTIDSTGSYTWYLSNGGCGKLSDTMSFEAAPCPNCLPQPIGATIICTPRNPASYQVTLTLTSPEDSTAYTIGTSIGPLDPFFGILPTAGLQPPMTLTLTILDIVDPLPDSVTITISYTEPDGSPCVQDTTLPLTPCTWAPPERQSNDTAKTTPLAISSSMLVFPNPTSGEVNISYNYGSSQYSEEIIGVYDEMGRKIQYTIPQNAQGTWSLNTNDWMPGIYIIRMEGDGKALQIQRMVVVSK